jgi:hypothetical protein
VFLFLGESIWGCRGKLGTAALNVGFIHELRQPSRTCLIRWCRRMCMRGMCVSSTSLRMFRSSDISLLNEGGSEIFIDVTGQAEGQAVHRKAAEPA